MRDRLLSGPRAIARDLIDKRLWPVALALLVALVAVPVVLGRSDAKQPATPAAIPATPAAPGSATAIRVAEQPVLGRSRPGPVHDPFYDPPEPKDSSSSPSTSSSSSTAKTPSTTGTGSGSGGTQAPSTVPPPSVTTPKAPSATTTSYSFYRPRARFGADAAAPVRGLSRLQPLGDKADPAALDLGPTADHTRAVFLLGPNAVTADGEGACGEKTCRVVALKAGQSLTLQLLGADGYVAQTFVLTVEEIAEQKVGSAAALLELRDRVDADGREVLRAMIKDRTTAAAVGKLTYDRRLGAVVLVTTL